MNCIFIITAQSLGDSELQLWHIPAAAVRCQRQPEALSLGRDVCQWATCGLGAPPGLVEVGGATESGYLQLPFATTLNKHFQSLSVESQTFNSPLY